MYGFTVTIKTLHMQRSSWKWHRFTHLDVVHRFQKRFTDSVCGLWIFYGTKVTFTKHSKHIPFHSCAGFILTAPVSLVQHTFHGAHAGRLAQRRHNCLCTICTALGGNQRNQPTATCCLADRWLWHWLQLFCNGNRTPRDTAASKPALQLSWCRCGTLRAGTWTHEPALSVASTKQPYYLARVHRLLQCHNHQLFTILRDRLLCSHGGAADGEISVIRYWDIGFNLCQSHRELHLVLDFVC